MPVKLECKGVDAKLDVLVLHGRMISLTYCTSSQGGGSGTVCGYYQGMYLIVAMLKALKMYVEKLKTRLFGPSAAS